MPSVNNRKAGEGEGVGTAFYTFDICYLTSSQYTTKRGGPPPEQKYIDD